MAGFYAQVTQATIDLVTTHSELFLQSGMTEFRAIAICLVVWEGFKVAFHMQPANRIASLLVSIAITYAALVYYRAPFPGVGKGLTKIITDAGADFAQQIDTSTEEDVGRAVSDLQGDMPATAWGIVTSAPALTRYFIIVLATSFMQVAILGIIAFGFVADGILVMIGPILIPFFLVPGLDWLATGWFRSLIQYSFYPVIGSAFVSIYGSVWMNFFSQFHGDMDVQKFGALLTQILILSMAGIYGILKVPQLVSGIFSGSSGISAMPGIGWWR